MRRRRVVVGLVVLALVAVLVVALWPRGTRPCRETFELVREGMTYDEVCATVGGPPGAYTRRPYIPLLGGAHDCRVQWAADDVELIVWFDDDQRAYKVMVFDPMPDDRPLLVRLRYRL